ncbi:MAG TPA: hypothetical protein VLM89_06225 [Phycisphaerae bacterium]|nr:hypothetical protein [Phycisphaerae bacterium]
MPDTTARGCQRPGPRVFAGGEVELSERQKIRQRRFQEIFRHMFRSGGEDQARTALSHMVSETLPLDLSQIPRVDIAEDDRVNVFPVGRGYWKIHPGAIGVIGLIEQYKSGLDSLISLKRVPQQPEGPAGLTLDIQQPDGTIGDVQVEEFVTLRHDRPIAFHAKMTTTQPRFREGYFERGDLFGGVLRENHFPVSQDSIRFDDRQPDGSAGQSLWPQKQLQPDRLVDKSVEAIL